MPEIDTELASAVTGQSSPSVRPPDFLLPKASGKVAEGRHRKIYLSWGGEIYGPATEEEVLAGIRASWFEGSAIYWHEGLEEWKPLADFPDSTPPTRGDWQRVAARDMPSAPSLPVVRSSGSGGHRRRRQRGSRVRAAGIGRGNRTFVVGIVFFAVLLTALILFLLMRV
jgi:hypothetical protein